MRARTITAVVGALVAVTAVAGCAPGAGVAAEVDGVTITESDVDGVLDDLGPFLARTSRDAVLTSLVQSQAGVELADRHGIEVTDERAVQLLDNMAELSEMEPREWTDGAVLIARMQLIGQEINGLDDSAAVTEEFYEILAGLDVDVSPRYGEYDPTTGSVVALSTPWIVDPAARGAGE